MLESINVSTSNLLRLDKTVYCQLSFMKGLYVDNDVLNFNMRTLEGDVACVCIFILHFILSSRAELI